MARGVICGCRASSADSWRRVGGTVDWTLVRAVAREIDRLMTDHAADIGPIFEGVVVDPRLMHMQECRSYNGGHTQRQSKKAVLETWKRLDPHHRWDLKLFAFWQTDDERVKSLHMFKHGRWNSKIIRERSGESGSTTCTAISSGAGRVLTGMTGSDSEDLTNNEALNPRRQPDRIRMSL